MSVSLDKEFIKLSQYLEELSGLHDKSLDACLKITYNQDKTKAYIRLIPPKIGGRMLTIEEALAQIKKEKIKNFDENIIENIIKKRIFNKDILLALGKPATKGKDAKIIYKFPFQEEASKEVIPGQVLLAKTTPTIGDEGITVDNRIIPGLSGDDVYIKLGVGVNYDGNVVYAEDFGRVIWQKEDEVSVEKLYELFTDLDENFEDIIDYPGRVNIYGSVRNRKIKAKTQIRITNNVLNSTLESDILNINGELKDSKVYSKKLYIREAINTYIRADYIEVEQSIIDCEVSCKILQVKGKISNSKIYAEKLINAKILEPCQIKLSTTGSVNFIVANPGVKINIADRQFLINKKMKNHAIKLQHGRIILSQYQQSISLMSEEEKSIKLKEFKIKKSPYPLSIVFPKDSLDLDLASEILKIPKEKLTYKPWGENLVLVHESSIFGPWEDEYQRNEKFQDIRRKESLIIRDGIFVFDNLESGLFLSVFPPISQGKKVQLQEVLAEIEKKNYKDINMELVEKAVSEANGLPVKVAPPQRNPELDGKVIVEVLPDKTKAFVTITPPKPGGIKVSIDDVLFTLKKTGVREGIKLDVITKLVKEEKVNTPTCVAEAVLPTKGEDAWIEYKFRTNPKIQLEEDEHGRINFKKLNLIENVKAGQLLAVKHEAKLGKPGFLVTGEKIPPILGKDTKIPAGKNTKLSQDNLRLFAECDGHVIISRGKITVEKIYKVDKDVGVQTGNVYFLGTVIVEGNVCNGYEVEASGDIHIKGILEGGKLFAEGSITVCGGIKGHNKAKVIAQGGDVIAKYIEQAYVKAARKVLVKKAILHSKICAEDEVKVIDKSAKIIGGEILANHSVEAVQIGCELSTKTKIIVGGKPSVREEINNLTKYLKETKKLLEEIKLKIIQLKQRKELGIITREQLKNLTRLSVKQTELTERIDKTEEYLQILNTSILKTKSAEVAVIDNIYPGVELTLKTVKFPIKKLYNFVRFIYEGGKVKILPYTKDKKS